MNEIYAITITEDGRTREVPAYTCGHCTMVVVLNAQRTRGRTACGACGRWLCEKNELCRVACTPIHAMAKDRFQGAGKWGRLVSPIMGGIETVEEARKSGFDV